MIRCKRFWAVLPHCPVPEQAFGIEEKVFRRIGFFTLFLKKRQYGSRVSFDKEFLDNAYP